LPLLRPGHSLQFAHLPAGADPDDLLKTDGRGALEQLLATPASLLDTLWEHERDAQPLTSPEDKAGLKERLMTHVEAIQHPDIKALSRRELLDRVSASAYPGREPPAREFRGGAAGAQRGRRFGGPPVRQGASDRLRRQVTIDTRDALAQAVLAGL